MLNDSNSWISTRTNLIWKNHQPERFEYLIKQNKCKKSAFRNSFRTLFFASFRLRANVSHRRTAHRTHKKDDTHLPIKAVPAHKVENISYFLLSISRLNRTIYNFKEEKILKFLLCFWRLVKPIEEYGWERQPSHAIWLYRLMKMNWPQRI